MALKFIKFIIRGNHMYRDNHLTFGTITQLKNHLQTQYFNPTSLITFNHLLVDLQVSTMGIIVL